MKLARRAISGVLLANKPAGISSTSAVGWAKRLFNAAKAGHTGTLDPFATGLLPICFGEAAKFARFHLDADKRYLATLKLGERSSTGDTEGEIVESRSVECTEIDAESVLAAKIGAQRQTPPMHSAIKVDGVPLYKLARKGLETERAERAIEIFSLKLAAWSPPWITVDAHVSKGTYIRVLAEDIGAALGCGAHLVKLERIASGSLNLAKATTFDELEAMSLEDRDALLLPPGALADALPRLGLSDSDASAFCNGRPVRLQAFKATGLHRIHNSAGRFLGVAQVCDEGSDRVVVPERLMSPDLRESD